MRLFLPGFICLSLVLSGCAGEPSVGGPNLKVAQDGALPLPMRQDYVTPDRPYIIGPLDQFSVNVFGLPDLSASVTVGSTGEIALPLIGAVHASGMTTDDLAADITKRLRRAYIRDPRVAVNVIQAASQTVTVDGAVQSPGIYPVVGRMSLMKAIARASGITEFARENYVVVYRQVGGTRYAGLYDLRAIRQGIYVDPDVYPNDLIEVGESRARRIFKDVLSAAPLITAPIIALAN